MKIKINGKDESLDQGKSLLDIVKDKGLNSGRIVIEYNLQIISTDEWEKVLLKDGDSVEMVSFMGGG
ncbi:MAG: sulfur carrier protein ThiS [Candidatus Omnitrophica bacterium]|nr:sulfur carrier protein ThiS [Candidatus Omnitrophota bacterium]